MIRLLQLGLFDAPGPLDGATKPRVASWSTSPEYYGIEQLWQRAWCFTADGNSAHSLPARNPIADALRAAELLKNNRTIESTGYTKRDSELRTLTQIPDNFDNIAPIGKTDALQRSGRPYANASNSSRTEPN